MKDYLNKYNSGTNRYRFWDYSAPGAYFITMTTKNREQLFGKISDKKVILSREGIIVKDYYEEMRTWAPNLILDEYIIMPDHTHCILIITDKHFIKPKRKSELTEEDFYRITPYTDVIQNLYLAGKEISNKSLSDYISIEKPSLNQIKEYRKLRRKMLIPKIIGKFKMQASRDINNYNNTQGKTNWQADNYDIIIENTEDYFHIKEYIRTNPQRTNR